MIHSIEIVLQKRKKRGYLQQRMMTRLVRGIDRLMEWNDNFIRIVILLFGYSLLLRISYSFVWLLTITKNNYSSMKRKLEK
jgi:hypothetical protein